MNDSATTHERPLEPANGWPVLAVCFAGLVTVIGLFAVGPVPLKVAGLLVLAGLVVTLFGFYIVNPNMARVLVLFGRYRGSVRREGFFWTNPFTVKHKLSLRAHNLDSATLKVNDLLGNPIEISAVVVWRVRDSARASFDVEDFEHYVRVQSEAALRGLATTYPYDDLESEGAEITLRGNTDRVVEELQDALALRLERAGVEVMEARLNHLAYAQEIAAAMLQRQQAKAIIAARRQIVDGAVGMVEMALARLSEEHILELDEERRATLVGNLLVVLCGQAAPQPVLNTGSLYN